MIRMLFCFLGSTPRVILGSRTPHTPSSTSGPGIIWWSIQFDRVVRLIRVFFFFFFFFFPFLLGLILLQPFIMCKLFFFSFTICHADLFFAIALFCLCSKVFLSHRSVARLNLNVFIISIIRFSLVSLPFPDHCHQCANPFLNIFSEYGAVVYNARNVAIKVLSQWVLH